MANTYYVATTGNDSNNGTTALTPFRTLGRAGTATVSGRGDTVNVKAGTYVREVTPATVGGANDIRGIQVKTGAKWIAEPGVVIDQQDAIPFGFVHQGGGCKDFVIDGFEIKNAKVSPINLRATNGVIKNNHLYNSSENGISIAGGENWSSGSDILEIKDNIIHHCANSHGARSGISILMAVTDTSYAALSGGYGIKITGNILYSNGKMQGGEADGNGIIIDKFHWNKTRSLRYTRKTLISGNFIFGNAGCGVKVMASEDVTIEYNTLWNNKQNATGTDSTWRGEIQFMYSHNCIVQYNVAFATNSDGGCLTNFHSATAEPDRDLSSNGHTFRKNVLWSPSGNLLRKGNPFDTAPWQLPSITPAQNATAWEYTNSNPLLKDPANSAKTISERFGLSAGSPALGVAPGGLNIGAWQTDGPVDPPDPNIEVDASPVMEILGDTIGTRTDGKPIYPVGASVRFTTSTYRNGPPDSVTRTAQWYDGRWADIAATISGPSGGYYTFTAPSVPRQGGLRVKETSTKGTVTVIATSDWIDIAPQTVTNEPPTNSVPPSISGTAAVDAVLSRSVGSWEGRPDPTLATQWKADGTDIAGATGASYTPVTADIGKVITVAVAGTNSEGTLTVTSAATAAVVDTRPPDDLTGLTRRMEAEEAKSGSQANDILTLFGLIRDLDTALKDAVTALGNRIGAVETYTSGSRERLDAVETLGGTNSESISDLQYRLQAIVDIIDNTYPGVGGSRGEVTDREIAMSLNMVEAGSTRETGRLLRAMLAGRTPVALKGST